MKLELVSQKENLELQGILNITEQKLKIKFPPLYSTFITSFKIGLSCGSINNEVFIDKYLRITPFQKGYSLKYNEEVMAFFGHLVPLKKISNYENNEQSYFNDFQLIYIGDILSPPGLFLGFGETNADKIYSISWEDNNGEPIKIANDIFDFLRRLEKEEKTYDINANLFTKVYPQKYYIDRLNPICLKEEAKKRLDETLLNVLRDKSELISFHLAIKQLLSDEI